LVRANVFVNKGEGVVKEKSILFEPGFNSLGSENGPDANEKMHVLDGAP